MPHSLKDCVIPVYPTIKALDVDGLAAGEHKFWFAIATDAIGHPQTLPVLVFKGQKPGKRLVITAAIHGDEQNGILTAQTLARSIKSKIQAGTVTIVPTVNLSGIARHSRDYHSAAPDSSSTNLNRIFPGNPHGSDAERFAHSLWINLIQSNADLGIDLHSQTSGSAYPLYAFANYQLDDCINMAKLVNPDVILDDPGDPGILETVYNQAGIPAITLEVGVGRYTDSTMVARAVEGILNILKHYGLIAGCAQLTEQKFIEGKQITSVRANQGGFVICHVNLLQKVSKGQHLASQFDSFGDIVEEYYSPTSATVISHNVESVRAPGSLIVRLLK